MHTITHPDVSSNGFGEQYRGIIFTMMIAELRGANYVYTPFIGMEHNYDKDVEFLRKKEQLINLISNLPIASLDTPSLNSFDLLHFIHKNIEACSKTKALADVKKYFFEGKQNPFDKKYVNIAVHVRRENQHDRLKNDSYPPDEIYEEIIEKLRVKHPDSIVHIYSQGKLKDFQKFEIRNTVLHIDESLENTFIQMAMADILVVAPSSLSYAAALVSDGSIVYIDHFNPPLPHWNVVQGYISARKLLHTLIIISGKFDPETNKFYTLQGKEIIPP